MEGTNTESAEKTHGDEPTPKTVAKPPFHRRRIFWLVCLGTTTVIFAILLPVLFLVIFPKAIRESIDSSVMTLSAIDLIMPMNETSFQLHSEGNLTASRTHDATLRFPDSLKITWNGTELGNFPLGDLELEDGVAKINQTITINITDPNRWVDFSTTLVEGEEFTWSLQGKTTVKALGITKSGFDFQKSVTLKAGNGFNNVTITNYTLGFITTPGGAPAIGQIISATLYSPADISLSVGSLGLDISYGALTFGLVQTNNLTISPGNNTLALQGPLALNISSFPPDVIVDLATKYKKGDNLTVTVRGAFAKPNGVDEVSWLSAAVKRLSFDTNLTLARNPVLDGLLNSLPSP